MVIKFKEFLKVILKLIFTFSFSGGLYLLIETVYHGYGSMPVYYIAGFIGLICLLMNDIFTYETDYLLQGVVSGLLATFLEGLVGNMVNMDYILWDYREVPLNFWNGQICVPFIFAWIALCLVVIPVLDYLEYTAFHYKTDTPPYYKIFGKKVFEFKKK